MCVEQVAQAAALRRSDRSFDATEVEDSKVEVGLSVRELGSQGLLTVVVYD
jgi:hypothetical protein